MRRDGVVRMTRYPTKDPRDLEPFYRENVESLTAEKLHSKSDIAVQLAWRDKEIVRLEARLRVIALERLTEGRHLENVCSPDVIDKIHMHQPEGFRLTVQADLPPNTIKTIWVDDETGAEVS